MASGRTGAKNLKAGENTHIYTVPDQTEALMTVSVCNRTSSAISIRIAHVDGGLGELAAEDWIEYNVSVGKVLERTDIKMAPGHSIIAYSDTAEVSVQTWGEEEPVRNG